MHVLLYYNLQCLAEIPHVHLGKYQIRHYNYFHTNLFDSFIVFPNIFSATVTESVSSYLFPVLGSFNDLFYPTAIFINIDFEILNS